MNLKILYDNENAPGFRSGWGFSALIDNTVLFDTGEDAGALQDNLRAFGIEPRNIAEVVISHADWDHVGGMGMLKACGRIDLYLPAGTADIAVQAGEQATLHEVIEPVPLIKPGILATGRLGHDKLEISLCVLTDKGSILITGCAHPGLGTIMKHASQWGKLYAVIGGFHGFADLDALADVPVIVPTHCTQHKQEILERYPDQARPGYAGLELNLPEA